MLRRPDPEFYANLWGTKKHVTSPTPPSSRQSWLRLRSRSGFVALFAAVILAGELVSGWMLAPSGRPQVVTSTDGGSVTVPTPAPAAPTTIADDHGAGDDPPDSAWSASEAGRQRSPVPVIFDTDMANDLDDSLALAMLHTYQRLGLVDLLAVTISYDQPHVAGFVDAVNTYYGAGETSIGAIRSGGVSNGRASFHRQIALNTARFPHDLTTNAKSEDATTLLRRQLAAQPDGSVELIAVGFSTNLAQLLDSPPDQISYLDGRELVARKVRQLTTMAGDFVRGRPEFNVDHDPASARAVYELWPTPIVTTEWQTGADVLFPTEHLMAMADPDSNPLLEAARLHAEQTLVAGFPYEQPTSDLAAVLAAVEPDTGYLALGPGGRITVDDAGLAAFTPGAGQHRLVERPTDPAARQRILDRYLTLVTTTPDHRQ
jgi:inosine-uridine nucleoside N-ribohydrolase